jgi:Ni/Fe-hydrogenase subunit HybB-like protein
MNAQESIAPRATTTPAIFVTIVAAALCVLGVGVIFTWHNIHSLGQSYNLIVLMAYNTAICMVTAGLALLSHSFKKRKACCPKLIQCECEQT